MNTDMKKYISMRMALEGSLLTSDKCGNRCVFCSNKLNPESVHTLKVENRALDELLDEINFFPSNLDFFRLGETTLNTTEGDLIEYPYYKELLTEIRKRYPNAEMRLTTSANCLTEDVIKFLKSINIVITISLHSLNPQMRAKLTGNTLERAKIAINSIDLCLKYQLPIFAIRIVPMPFVTNEDLYNTIAQLIQKGVEKIEIGIASFSKFAKKENVENCYNECERIFSIVEQINQDFQDEFYDIKVFPFYRNKYNAEIEKVRKNSYVYKIGLRNKDKVLKINNQIVVNGGHFQDLIADHIIQNILIERNNENIYIDNINPQLIQETDIITNCIIDGDIIFKIAEQIQKDVNHVLLLSSEATYDIIQNDLKKLGINKYYQYCVKNEEFGGNICINGLLTIKDYLKAIQDFRKQNPQVIITKVLVARDAFRLGDADLTNEPLKTLRLKANVQVILI